jgi:predicted HicB family RNase H-like nuclease
MAHLRQLIRTLGYVHSMTGGADFYGKTPKELRAQFKKSLAVFLAVCKEKGMEPSRSYSGKFNLRIPPELHERLAIAAQAEGKSINMLVQEALARRVAGSTTAPRSGCDHRAGTARDAARRP